MSAICLSRPHGLSETRRQQALKELSLHLGEALGAAVMRQAWTLQFEGEGFVGTVTLGEGYVECEIKLGTLMRPLKGVITREIDAGLARYLADTGR